MHNLPELHHHNFRELKFESLDITTATIQRATTCDLKGINEESAPQAVENSSFMLSIWQLLMNPVSNSTESNSNPLAARK
jgi:hypothetical protein